jgi:hypothetical protein
MCFAACNVSVEGVSGDDVAHRELRKQEMMSLVYSGVVGEKTVKGITAALLVSDTDRWLMPQAHDAYDRAAWPYHYGRPA